MFFCRLFLVKIFFIAPLFFAQYPDKIKLIERVKSSVVWIHSFRWPFLTEESQYNFGTGYIIGNNWVVTNYHVIHNSTGIAIFGSSAKDGSTPNEQPYYAYPVWSDSTLDLALLKTLDNTPFSPLRLAREETIKIGQDILVFGFPSSANKQGSIKVTSGIISSDPKDDNIQIDAPVNPGNSGGPCINYDGEVVGTVFAKAVALSVEGIGYIKNIKLLKQAINLANSKDVQSALYDFAGTKLLTVYKDMCYAQMKLWQSQSSEQIYEKRNLILDAKTKMLSAIDHDKNCAIAHYFLASFFLQEALTNCLDNNDFKANMAVENFQKELKEAIKLKASLEYLESTKLMKDFVYRGTINCEALRRYVKDSQLRDYEASERVREFLEYLEKGDIPDILKRTLLGEYKDYSTSKIPEKQIEEKSRIEKLLDGIRPAIVYSSTYLGNPIIKEGSGQRLLKNIEISTKIYGDLGLSFGILKSDIEAKIKRNFLSKL